MNPFSAVVDFFTGLISQTDFWEMMSDLDDKAPDPAVFVRIQTVLAELKVKTEMELSNARKKLDLDQLNNKLFKISLYQAIYQEVSEKLVYVSWSNFMAKMESLIEQLITLNAVHGKKFVLTVIESWAAKGQIKSNLIFNGLLLHYLKKSDKLDIIAGITVVKSIADSAMVFLNGAADAVTLRKAALASYKTIMGENVYHLYVDDGLYSGNQYLELRGAFIKLTNGTYDLYPVVTYMREDFENYPEFAEKEYRLNYGHFPLASKITAESSCYVNDGHVLGYFQHRIPDDVSISNCLPFLDTCEEDLGVKFGYRSILRYLNRKVQKIDPQSLVEYKMITYQHENSRPTIMEELLENWKNVLAIAGFTAPGARQPVLTQRSESPRTRSRTVEITSYEDLSDIFNEIKAETEKIKKVSKNSWEIIRKNNPRLVEIDQLFSDLEKEQIQLISDGLVSLPEIAKSIEEIFSALGEFKPSLPLRRNTIQQFTKLELKEFRSVLDQFTEDITYIIGRLRKSRDVMPIELENRLRQFKEEKLDASSNTINLLLGGMGIQ